MNGPEVSILQAGTLKRAGDGTIIEAHSTVVLVRSLDQVIVIDSGAPDDAPRIDDALRSVGVAPADVDLVINTHRHVDHVGSNHLFTGARFMAHVAELDIVLTYPVTAALILVTEEHQVDRWVRIFPTPGHSRGSLSVLIKDAHSTFGATGETIVIAGDALPLQANYLKGVPPAIHCDRAESCRSMARILAVADWVIPGHDRPFRVRRKESS